MEKCSQWQNRPIIRRMAPVCSPCRDQLKSVADIVERLKPEGGDDVHV
jgi:hypothetical protein